MEDFKFDAGDVILRSVDGVRFHVFNAILSLASPFFNTLFSIPQSPAQSTKLEDGGAPVQIVDVAEDSTTLDIVLRYCYPIHQPAISDIAVVDRVLSAALKYEIAVATEAMQIALVSKPFLDNEPIRAYLVACKHNLQVQARTAAKATLAQSIFDFQGKELEEVSAGALLRLFKYRKRVTTRLVNIFNKTATAPEGVQEDPEVTLLRPRCGGLPHQNGCGDPAKFWIHFLIRAVPLISEIPHTKTIFEDQFLRPISDVIRDCDTCRDSHAVRMWYKNIEGTISNVYDRVAESVDLEFIVS